MIQLILVGFLIICFIAFPFPKFFVANFFEILKYVAMDTYFFVKHKEYNRCKNYGSLKIVSAYKNKVFGSGKSLYSVKYIRDIYNRYNGLSVWDEDTEEFVEQKIHIISNVDLMDVPYTKFVSVEQLLHIEQDPNDVTIIFIDEIGGLYNSRDFKTNFSTEQLRELMQMRKSHVGLLGTAPRFKHCDALLRQIAGSVIGVNKFWRFIKVREFDPSDIENCDNLSMIRPLYVSYSFVNNQDYASYDTNQKILRSREDILPDEQILANQGVKNSDLETVNLKKRYRGRKHSR